jgi:predicted ATP-grasp superfamily ATP-dependent carboligase
MRVVITNGTGDLGASAAASLRREGFEVHAVDGRGVPRCMASRHLHGYACIDDQEPMAWQDAVLRFIDRVKADVFLPLCTRGAVLAVQRRSDLECRCRVNVPDEDAFLAAYDKRRCMDVCARLGIPCAGSMSREAALALLREPGGSVVVKPALDVGQASGLRHVTDAAHLDDAIVGCTARHGGCLIQEYIPGGADAMHTVTVVCSGTGRLAGGFTARKVRHWPSLGGVTACGVSTREELLVDGVLPFFDRMRWRGPAEVELKRDPRDGRFKVIEINPRFPGYLRLASVSGVELVPPAARAALGEEPVGPTTLSDYREGMVYVAPTVFARSVAYDASARGWIAALSQARADASGSWPMLRSLLSDPLPIITRTFVAKTTASLAAFTHMPAIDDPSRLQRS